jgi:hypothetical protein
MQEKQVFEYAVIRVVPRVEREEFVNVGVIVYCPKQRFLQTIITLNEARLLALSDGLDLDCVTKNLCAFEQICRGGTAAGPIGKLDAAARFRWLTATRSTVVQCSKIHPGLCSNPHEMLTRLHAQLVL